MNAMELLRQQLLEKESLPTEEVVGDLSNPKDKELYINLLVNCIANGCDLEELNKLRYWLLPRWHGAYVKPYPYHKPFHYTIVYYSTGLSNMLDATGRLAWGLTFEEQETIVKLLEKHYGYSRPEYHTNPIKRTR